MERIDGLFDDDVLVLHAPVELAHVDALTPREREAIARARDKRRKEYATARVLAREGLRERFGIRGFELLNAEDRSPIWPDAVAGSVTHCDTRAMVALTDRAARTVGVDMEHREVLEEKLWSLTLLPDEVAALERLPSAEREAHALVYFSAKEALYKAQHPRTREYMEFAALKVEVAHDGALACVFQRDVAHLPKGFVAPGRWRRLESGEIVTAVWIDEASL